MKQPIETPEQTMRADAKLAKINAELIRKEAKAIQSAERVLAATVASPMPSKSKKAFNAYMGKLNLLGMIHAENADKINATREATLTAFFMPSDKFIPESKDKKLLVKLALGIFDAMTE